MSEHFLVTLKEFRRIHTIYMVTFGLLLLNVVANPRVSDEDGMVIFGVAAVWHRYSLVIGLLSGLFAIMLLLKIRHLEELADDLKDPGDRHEAKMHLEYLPWVLSPFRLPKTKHLRPSKILHLRPSEMGYYGFWASLAIGSGYVAFLGIRHITGFSSKGIGFGVIGIIDVLIFFGTIDVLFEVSGGIKKVVGKLFEDAKP